MDQVDVTAVDMAAEEAVLLAEIPTRFDSLPVGWHRAAVRVYGERCIEALDALVRAHGPTVSWPGRDAADYALGRIFR